jgi:hypothetical protein
MGLKLCLKEAYNKVRIGKNLSDSFPIQKGLRERYAQSLSLFNFALEYAIKKIHENQEQLKMNGTH